MASPAGSQPTALFAARSAMAVMSTRVEVNRDGRPFAKCATGSWPLLAATSDANRAGRSACGIRSIFTLTPFFVPQSAAHLSRYVSKSGTKWLHWRMFRSPLSFLAAALPPALAAGAFDPPLVLGLPMQAAAIGTAAAAAAPLRRVRRSIFRWVTSSTLLTSRAGIRVGLCARSARRNGGFAVRETSPLRRLGAAGLGFLGVEPEVGDGPRHVGGRVLLVEGEPVQRGHRDALGVDLEESTEGLAGIAAAEAVGPQRHEWLRAPAADLVGQRFQVVGGGDDRTRVAQHLGDVRHARRGFGMEPVPALGLEGLVPQ